MTTTFREVATGIREALLASTDITDLVEQRVARGKPGVSMTFPLIRMQPQANSDDVQSLGSRAYEYFYVSVIASSQDADEADEICAVLDGLLERQPLVIGNPNKHGKTVRMGTIWYQQGDGNTYTHSGGIYRIGVRT